MKSIVSAINNSSNTNFVLGVDLGGTKCSAAVINTVTGEFITETVTRTHEGENFLTVLLEVIAAVQQLAPAGCFVSAIGIGCAGIIDAEEGEIILSHNLKTKDFPLATIVSEETRLSCYVVNDVEAAALGELKFGSGRDSSDFVVVFVGTGIGARLVQNGKIRRGVSGTAGEFGQTLVRSLIPPAVGEPSYRSLESYCSRPGISSLVLSCLDVVGGQSQSLSYSEINQMLTGEVVSERLAANFAISTSAELLGVNLANLVNFVNPERIILGGGVIEQFEGYFEQVEMYTRVHSLERSNSDLQFSRASLGNNAGVLGAAMLGAEG